MHLSVPQQYSTESWHRPPLHTRVSIVSAENSDSEWVLDLRLRLDDADLAVALAEQAMPPEPLILIVREAGIVRRYPVALTPLRGPIAGWRIMYQGPPTQEDMRHNQRFPVELSGWVMRTESPHERHCTQSYDISRTAIRFFVPWSLAPGDIVSVHWMLPAVIAGTMQIVRCDPTSVFWHGGAGYHVVGIWESLPDAMARQWHRYCWQQQDGMLLS